MRYGNVVVGIHGDAAPRTFRGLADDDVRWRVSELAADIESDDGPIEAVTGIGPLIERIADLLSFQLAAPILWGQVDIVDITPPVAEGDSRDFVVFPTPPFDVNVRGFPGSGVQGNYKGVLPATTDLEDTVAASLRWYNKSIRNEFLHDQFIALWIALELLCDRSSASVTEPYVANCGHRIVSCPECGRPTSRKVRGATLRKFLCEQLGLDQDTASELWKMRQMLHGAVRFDPKKLGGLPILVMTLRRAITTAISTELAPLGHTAPIPLDNDLTVHPAIAASGYRDVGAQDISPL